jgi:hypothetical protein
VARLEGVIDVMLQEAENGTLELAAASITAEYRWITLSLLAAVMAGVATNDDCHRNRGLHHSSDKVNSAFTEEVSNGRTHS